MSLRSEYDLWHQRVADADPAHPDASSPWYQLVRESLGPVRGLRVLELACGRCGFVAELARAGANVTGCDFSFSAVRIGQSALRSLHQSASWSLLQPDAQNLPLAHNSFDLVISCETIEHVPDVHSALREMYRVTRPGGRLFLTTPSYANFTGLYYLYAKLRHPHHKDDQPFDRRQLFSQVRRWLRQAGWSILHTDGTVHQFPLLPGHNPFRIESLESTRFLRKVFSPFALHYFVIAQKPNPA
jgi:ubiquinone/menaquinone biosynthesis C-methylase UbiE